jgi:hypothetical protein
MRPTKRFAKLLSDPSIDGKAINYLQEHECEICGAAPMADWTEFICSVAHPEHEGWGEYWRYRYNVCLDCLKAGIASFPDRLRTHAQKLEERTRELRRLAADAKWRTSGRHDAEVCAQDGADDEVPF